MESKRREIKCKGLKKVAILFKQSSRQPFYPAPLKVRTLRPFIISVILYFPLSSLAFAGPPVEVIYPKEGQVLTSYRPTFIFGNTTPGSSLKINSARVSTVIVKGLSDIKEISWSQPETGLYQLKVRLRRGRLWEMKGFPSQIGPGYAPRPVQPS